MELFTIGVALFVLGCIVGAYFTLWAFREVKREVAGDPEAKSILNRTLDLRAIILLLSLAPAFAASPWTAYQNGVGGVTVRADSDTQIYADVSETTTFHYIADTELGGRLRRSDTITASFVMNFWMESAYDGDLRVGFFESQGGSLAATYAMGLRLMDPFQANPGTMRVYPTISYQGAVLFENALSLETNVNWGIGLTWTPTGGNHGQGYLSVTATNQSTLAVQTTSLHPSVDTLGFSVNAFGIVNGYHSAGDTERVQITVTDPTYSTIATPAALPANMRVFLLLGQSNARGNNGSETNLWPANTYESTNTFIFTDKEWGYARVNAAMHNDIGPEISFASAVSAKLGVPVGIIKTTRGGTALPAFLPAAADMYPQITNAAIPALALLTTPNLVGVLHVAGESDAGNATYAANYGANVATLMTALRTDLSRPGLTNIVSRLHNTAGLNEGNVALIRTAQEAYHYVNTDDLTLIDTIHFDTDSQMELGERMANEYFEILNGAPPARVATGQHYPLIIANAASLAALNPNGRQLAVLKNGGGLFWYDSDSLWPTNATYCFKPADYDGRWRPLSTVPGVTEKALRDLSSLDAGLALGYKTTDTLTVGTDLTIGGSSAITADELSTSQELRSFLSDETGTGAAVFGTSPTIANLNISEDLQLSYGASVTVNEMGELQGKQNGYAVNRGAVAHYDGTAVTLLIGALESDTPSNGQVPKFNTGGTITWENDLGLVSADLDTLAELNAIVGDADVASIAGSETLSNKTLASPTVTGSITFPDNTRQTFNPGADAAGLNVGSHAGDPGTPSNGDIWYDSVANELTARINDANVALGAGGGGSVSDDAYGAGWNGSTGTAPSQNSVYDKINAMVVPVKITFGHTGAGNLSASTTYYFGLDGRTTWTTTVGNTDFPAGSAFTIKQVFIRFVVATTLASAGNCTVTLNINGSDTDTLSTTFTLTANYQTLNVTGLSRAVTSTDMIAIKITTPAWATPPTNVTAAGIIYGDGTP